MLQQPTICLTLNAVSFGIVFPSSRFIAPANKLSGVLWRRGGKRKESLQLRLWNLNSTSNCPVAPRGLNSQIFANQREAETSANVNKHCKTRCKGNDVITNVTFASQHFASTFSMQIIKFQRRSCRAPLIACSEATRFRKALTYILSCFEVISTSACGQMFSVLFIFVLLSFSQIKLNI